MLPGQEMGAVTDTKPITTEFIVSVNAEPRKAEVEFAEMLGDVSFVEKWREALGTNPEPKQREAADLAQLARERFLADSRVGQPYLSTAEDLAELIHGEPESEVGAFILLKCEWFAHSRVIGLCHFRRTWCNNIVVDYLATHPLILREGIDQVKVKGVGAALLCFISRLAVANSCSQMWGEATLGSHPFYEYIFDLKGVKDLFIIPPENYILCANRKLDWQPQEGVNAMNMQAVEKLYDVEEKHPPLVGNRTQIMVGSKRQLISHFLDLPRYKQDEVARSLGLLNDEDADILEDQWCGILFQRAVKAGKLRELWDEIEKRHEHGEPENNPFIG